MKKNIFIFLIFVCVAFVNFTSCETPKSDKLSYWLAEDFDWSVHKLDSLEAIDWVKAYSTTKFDKWGEIDYFDAYRAKGKLEKCHNDIIEHSDYYLDTLKNVVDFQYERACALYDRIGFVKDSVMKKKYPKKFKAKQAEKEYNDQVWKVATKLAVEAYETQKQIDKRYKTTYTITQTTNGDMAVSVSYTKK